MNSRPTMVVGAFLLAISSCTAFNGIRLNGNIHVNKLKVNSRPRHSVRSLSMSSSSSTPELKGCAATPFEKKRVVVFGAGGYLGANTFGFLQRASSLYHTGIAGPGTHPSPRNICATAAGSDGMNRILGKNFKLAYASESSVRLTNLNDVDSISARLKGFDAVVLGTAYQLERRPVTGNTYEVGPNDRAFEIYLDDRTAARTDCDELDVHLSIFRNSIRACEEVGIEHVVVIETPRTSPNAKAFAKVLDESSVTFTYIHSIPDLVRRQDYTFERGIQSDLQIQSFTLSAGYKESDGYDMGDWMTALSDVRATTNDKHICKEDIAALAVQSLLSLDWTKSRCLEVSSSGKLFDQDAYDTYNINRPFRSDGEWCVHSSVLAEKLAVVE